VPLSRPATAATATPLGARIGDNITPDSALSPPPSDDAPPPPPRVETTVFGSRVVAGSPSGNGDSPAPPASNNAVSDLAKHALSGTSWICHKKDKIGTAEFLPNGAHKIFDGGGYRNQSATWSIVNSTTVSVMHHDIRSLFTLSSDGKTLEQSWPDKRWGKTRWERADSTTPNNATNTLPGNATSRQ
jgi:hypothetical protein